MLLAALTSNLPPPLISALLILTLVVPLMLLSAAVALKPTTVAFSASALRLTVSFCKALTAISPSTSNVPLTFTLTSASELFSAYAAKSALIRPPPLPSALAVLSLVPAAVTFKLFSKVPSLPLPLFNVTLVTASLFVMAWLFPLENIPPMVMPLALAEALAVLLPLMLRLVAPAVTSS